MRWLEILEDCAGFLRLIARLVIICVSPSFLGKISRYISRCE
jgi:hypothetical protein